MKKKVCGVGITDVLAIDENGKQLKSYCAWKHMIERCCSEKYREKYPTYKNCTVCESWITYSNFKKFYDANFKEGTHLDKDLLQQNVEHKVYSPTTCLFLPRALNNFFTNNKSDNTTGYRGVTEYRWTNRYLAQINIYDHETKTCKKINLGYFTDPELAELVYIIARQEQAEIWKSVMVRDYGWSSELAELIK